MPANDRAANIFHWRSVCIGDSAVDIGLSREPSCKTKYTTFKVPTHLVLQWRSEFTLVILLSCKIKVYTSFSPNLPCLSDTLAKRSLFCNTRTTTKITAGGNLYTQGRSCESRLRHLHTQLRVSGCWSGEVGWSGGRAVYSTYRLDELDTCACPQANWTYPLPPYTGQTGLSSIQDQSVVKMEDTNWHWKWETKRHCKEIQLYWIFIVDQQLKLTIFNLYRDKRELPSRRALQLLHRCR